MQGARKIYESEADRANEKSAIEDACHAWGCGYRKMPRSYRLDYYIFRPDGMALGFAEVKSRNFVWGKYPDIILSVSKAVAAVHLFDATGLSSRLIISADDRIMWCPFSSFLLDRDLVRWGGRTTNTRDNEDTEPVFHIPNKMFSEL